MKKINLAENMLRFGVKNLNEASRHKLIKEADASQPKFGDMVTYQGKSYAVIASAYDNVGFESTDPFIAAKIRQARATQDNWVLLQTRPNVPVDQAYSEITSDQIEYDWNQNIFMFVPVTNLKMSSSTNQSATASTKLNGSWEEFMAAIANEINTDNNDPRSMLTADDVDSMYNKLSADKKDSLRNGTWGEYKWSVGTNKPDGAAAAVTSAIENFFSKS